MKHPLSRSFYAFWDRSRGSRPVPERSGIVPTELGALLVNCFLIDLAGAAQARFRFCGSSLAVRYGRDLTDEDFLSLWQGADRRAWSDALAHMRRMATGMVAGIGAETMGSGFATFELVLLPVEGSTGCDCAIGCMVRVGGHEETNRIKARIVAQALDSYRCLDDRRGFIAARHPGAASAPRRVPRRLALIEGNPSPR